MSKYIIITPYSEEYPNFHIEEGLYLDVVSIYPHNNTNQEEYSDTLVVGDKTYQKKDLVKVSNQYGEYCLSQVSDMTHFYFNKNSVSDLLLTNTIYYKTGIEKSVPFLYFYN